MLGMIRAAWRLSKGYRLRPWASPYLKWRMETWSGIPAETIDPKKFLSVLWEQKAEVWRYLRWAGREGR